MDKYTTFDNYIKGEMTESEAQRFEESLKIDKSLKNEFQLYLETVSAIIKEEEQDSLEFAHAMKNISEEDFSEIIGTKQTKGKTISLTKYISTTAIAAAASIIAIVSPISVSHVAQIQMNNLLFNYEVPLYASRGDESRGDGDIDYHSMSDEQLETIIPSLTKEYKESFSPISELENGKLLAMVHIKLNQRKEAKEILNKLINKYSGDEDYDVSDLERILKQIK